MSFMPSKTRTAVRQTSTAAFNGSVCQKNMEVSPGEFKDVVFEAKLTPDTGVIQYVAPTDGTTLDADQGGEFTFNDETVIVSAIRADIGAGAITVEIVDKDGSHKVTHPDSGFTAYQDLNLAVMSSQKLLISSATAGWVEVVVTKGDWF